MTRRGGCPSEILKTRHMFTGIIEKVATIQAVTVEGQKDAPSGSRVTIATSYTDLELGESIAVNGVCLTVAEILSPTGDALFFLSAETLARSNLKMLKAGNRVNLERALQAKARLSGHIVQGHVDGFATLAQVTLSDECYLIELDLTAELSRYCVEKGSIALNGVSLTINRIEPRPGAGSRIFITLIPHTWEHTSFSEFRPGDSINVEVDVLAKYVEKLCQPYLNRSST